MKFFIVLFAVVAAVSAGFYHEPPWVAPVVHPAPIVHATPVHAPWAAPSPHYVKVAAPVAYAKEVHHAHFIPQQPAIPPPHPSPLHLKADAHVGKIHYSGPHVPHPHLVGVEHYAPAPEPEISVVKTHGKGWD